jgi:hypothetical protein
MLSTLKKKRSQKFVWELPDGTCKLNPKKIIETPNQNENVPKKNYVSYFKSVKEPKIRIWATRRSLQAQPKIL